MVRRPPARLPAPPVDEAGRVAREGWVVREGWELEVGWEVRVDCGVGWGMRVGEGVRVWVWVPPRDSVPGASWAGSVLHTRSRSQLRRWAG